MADVIKTLKKALKKHPVIAPGSVVVWKSSIYTYAAVYTGGKWWITGTGRWYGGNVFDTQEFVDKVLADARSVKVATAWEELK